MTRILCASIDCKWNGEDNYCTAEEIKLNYKSVMTVWEGRQQLCDCKQYEMSDKYKEMYDRITKRYLSSKGETNDSGPR